MPRTIASFIQAFPGRGDRGGGGGAISGGGFAGITGGGVVWPCAIGASFSIVAEIISRGRREQARFGTETEARSLVWHANPLEFSLSAFAARQSAASARR